MERCAARQVDCVYVVQEPAQLEGKDRARGAGCAFGVQHDAHMCGLEEDPR